MLARLVTAVVDTPEFGSLGFWVPLAERVTKRVHPFFGSGTFFVAAGTTEHGVEFILGNGVEQGHGLQRVAAGSRARRILHAAGVDRGLHRTHNELHVEFGHGTITKLNDFREVVPRIDMHHGEGHPGWGKGPNGQVQHDYRVFAPRKQHDWALEFGGYLPDNGDGFVD